MKSHSASRFTTLTQVGFAQFTKKHFNPKLLARDILMRKLFIVVYCLLVLVSTLTFAGQSIVNQKIRHIGTGWGAEGIYVLTVTNTTSTEGCGPKFMIEPSHVMRKEMVSLLLSAFHTGANVNLYVAGCINTSIMNLKAVSLSK